MRTPPFLILVALIVSASGIAQPNPTFEAASIKPDKGCPGPYGRALPGRLVMNCYSVHELAAFAWGLRKEQVVGQLFSDRYDIEATMGSAAPGPQIVDGMLQALLEDRFALKVHRETREMPVYKLVIAKGGVKMAAAKGDCVVSPADGGPPLPSAQSRPRGPLFFCNHPNTGPRTMEGKGITSKALADSLSGTELHRTVVDKTGLSGAFDINLHWVTEPSSPLYDGVGGAPAAEPGAGPSIFTAIEEQLGLKLVTGRGPDEVLVIDRAEKPRD